MTILQEQGLQTNCVLEQVTESLPGSKETLMSLWRGASKKTASVLIMVTVKGVPTSLRVGVTCTD